MLFRVRIERGSHREQWFRVEQGIARTVKSLREQKRVMNGMMHPVDDFCTHD